MRALTIVLALCLAGCASIEQPRVWKDWRGKCHAIVGGMLLHDVDCAAYLPKNTQGAGDSSQAPRGLAASV